MNILFALAVGFAAVTATDETLSIKLLSNVVESSCELIQPLGLTQLHRGIQGPNDTLEVITPRQNKLSTTERVLVEPVGSHVFIEMFGRTSNAVQARAAQLCPNGIKRKHLRESFGIPPATIQKIADSGDPKNCIDVVFTGDGDMFTGNTFAQYLPLFNIWASYVPSAQSGIGVGGTPRDMAFVYTSKPDVARSVCAQNGAYACDCPSLIANDDLYGGLGGDLVISTRSPTSEEYGGSQVFSGANSALSASTITWKHWRTEPTKLTEQKWALLYQKHNCRTSKTARSALRRWYSGSSLVEDLCTRQEMEN
ncbi:hypothetical protein H310_09896 [Aphanomyces invadans]|uniref:Uncharacterized protein n=1 Tax=Aphanomyces invadans TaxID=157072 RepID=A0A024TSU4_9STRA|nr:hypothetical protein H310_09896 [Aphanomyces invadans]ETV97074.1 hypothetical protein H310_09896 [Aphanomyces invadans]|eukprot:XP_008874320.1 hypothetical protein H310_09896 [Aphanomyces invadans]